MKYRWNGKRVTKQTYKKRLKQQRKRLLNPMFIQIGAEISGYIRDKLMEESFTRKVMGMMQIPPEYLVDEQRILSGAAYQAGMK